jgi:hypothetical protein
MHLVEDIILYFLKRHFLCLAQPGVLTALHFEWVYLFFFSLTLQLCGIFQIRQRRLSSRAQSCPSSWRCHHQCYIPAAQYHIPEGPTIEDIQAQSRRS